MSKKQMKSSSSPDQMPAIAPQIRAQDGSKILALWNESLLSFYFTRMQQYWQLPLEFPKYGSPGEFEELQTQFTSRMLDDYKNQAEKLLSIVTREQRSMFDSADAEYANTLLKAQEDALQIIDQAKAQAKRIIESAETHTQNVVKEDKTLDMKPSDRRKSA